MPDGNIGIDEKQVRNLLSTAFKGDMNNPYKVFNDDIPPLIKKGIIHQKDNFYWL